MKKMVQGFMMLVATAASGRAFTGEVAFSNPLAYSCTEMESFLLHAQPGEMKSLSTGVTNTRRLKMSDGTIQHDAHLQTVDETKSRFEGVRGGVELNFRDSYKYNIAAYRLAKLLGLNMVPPYVERRISGASGSLSWWVNDAMMEAERYRRNIHVPDPESWNAQMYAVRVFHQLVYDTDPNLTNLLITKDWQVWIIDLTRAFRTNGNLRDQKDLVKCDRRLLERMREIDGALLKQTLNGLLTKSEIQALDARRAKIVQFFDNEIRSKGQDAVLYDFPRSAQACGTGL